MFQRVLAEIKAGANDGGKVLDELAADRAFDLENRWQAEWSLARALQLQGDAGVHRSEEHTSELQSQSNLVCRLLLEKKKTHIHLHLADYAQHRHHVLHANIKVVRSPFVLELPSSVPALRTSRSASG